MNYYKKLSFVGLTIVLLSYLVPAAFAIDAPLPPEIEDPEIQGINKEAPHATLMPYATLAQALAAKRFESPFYCTLNGSWKFNWVKHPAERPVDFFQPAFDVSAWREISVPSCWQTVGYGTPSYRNHGYIFKVDFPHVMGEPPKNFTSYDERNPVGSYRREFTVPVNWNGRRTFIHFDGVDSCLYLWINGQKVGFSTNSRCPAEFDITPYLKSGTNTVAAEVYRFSAGSYFEDQDMYRLSGIFRNVYLWSAPQVHLRDFALTTDLDALYKDANLAVKAKIRNYGSQPAASTTLTVALYGPSGKDTGITAKAAVPVLKAGEEITLTLQCPVPAPEKWTAETPVLYTTVLKVGEELISARTGFRKVECKGPVFTINGVPVKLKGTNRHENHPDTGHTVSEERMIEDLRLIKGANMNHVRASHYTNDPRWYELCDEWGIYLVAEANVETHGLYGVLDREPRARTAIVQRNIDNVESVKNHASVVIWSLGNECGWGDNFRAANTAVKALDSTRPTYYEPFDVHESNPCDIVGNMYPTIDFVRKIGSGTNKKPYYVCEYAHAMNNSMGSIGDYNDAFDESDNIVGGAIWEWQDQSLWNDRVPGAPKHLVYGGGFGEFPHDGYFICKGVVFADRSLTPKYPEAKRVYQWIDLTADDLAAGRLAIRNRYQFTNTNRFDIVWTVSEDGSVIDRGTLARLDLNPRSKGTLALQLKTIKPKAGAAYHLRVAFVLAKNELWAQAGTEIAVGQFVMPVANNPVPATKLETLAALKVDDNAQRVQISGTGFSVVIAKSDGAISELVYEGRNVLLPNGGPRLNLWRAPHFNDDMWTVGVWERNNINKLVHKARRVTVTTFAPGAIQVVADIASENTDCGFDSQVAYTITGDGVIAIDQAIDNRGNRFVVARMGMRLMIDPALERFTWLGRGPHENYSDRKRGADIGLWSSTVRDQLVPYVKPMECGNHEDVSWTALTRPDGSGLMTVAQYSPFTAAALPQKDEALFKAGYAYQLPPSPGTVLSLNAATLGIGSASCGPKVLERYRTYSDPAVFSLVLRPIPTGTSDLAALARTPVTARVAPVNVVRGNDRLLTLSCATPGAKIRYAIDGEALKAYSGPVAMGKTMTAIADMGGMLPLPARQLTMTPGLLDRTLWLIVACDSQQEGEGAANAIDDDSDSYWHTAWDGKVTPPHAITVDFGTELRLSAATYRGRNDSNQGRIKEYEIYLSLDGKNWGQPAAKGQFEDNAKIQNVVFAQPVNARFLRLVALSEVKGRAWTSVADLNVILAK